MINVDKLDNGVSVVMEEMPSVRSVAVGIWIRTGSIMETVENKGISHFIEHMLFKGTAKRTAKEIAEDMSAIGGHINAFTAKEYTCFYAQCLDEHIEIAIEILADMLQHATFSEEEIKKEKIVVLDEIDMYEDSPEEIVYELFQQGIFKNHPLGYNILGEKKIIENFNREGILDYFKSHYTRNKIVISVAGHFKQPDMLKSLNKYFHEIGPDQEVNQVEKPSYHRTFVYKDKDIEQVHLSLGYPGITYLSRDIYTLAILNVILGGSMNSKLFQSIREEQGLAYSIYSYSSTYKEAGLLNIYAATNPAYVEQVLLQVKKEVKDLKYEGITDEMLSKTKEQLKSNYIIGLESTNSRMSSHGKSMTILGKIRTQDEILRAIDQVTIEDFQRLAEQIFQEDQLSLSIVGRLNQIDMKKVEDIWRTN